MDVPLHKYWGTCPLSHRDRRPIIFTTLPILEKSLKSHLSDLAYASFELFYYDVEHFKICNWKCMAKPSV